MKNNEARQTWKVYDYISECPVDIVANFVKNTLQITDLNKNGIAEVWVMYRSSCRSDVSPADMKIIMYEGQQKYAMRGTARIFQGTDDKGKKYFDGGKYKYDQAFASKPEFLKFAKELWNKNILENSDEGL